MSSFRPTIPVDKFYGRKTAAQIRIEAMPIESDFSSPSKSPDFMKQLLGPSKTWKIFKKQKDAINSCLRRGNGLMCFAFEQNGGQRLFLVAHPKVFWAINHRRFFRNCSTYEIIQEHSRCKLYFDIEFEYEYNRKNCGDRMLSNFLKVVNYNLRDSYDVSCTLEDVLNLDSSNNKKYSHHVIYQIPYKCFQDNYACGNFVHVICNELKVAYERNASGCEDEIIKIATKYSLMEEDILEFFVRDCKEKTKIFVDEGVYTKNRHFRLLGSTKWNKNSPLMISKDNRYASKIKDESGLSVFLDSLITHFSDEVKEILKCEGVGKQQGGCIQPLYKKSFSECEETTIFPEIDQFILKLIFPFGAIRRKLYFSSTSKIVYEIVGYRYCNNIKRHHKSNNIMFVIDLKTFTFCQKCHDPDCRDFKSDSLQLPEEICFQLQDDSEFKDFKFDDKEDDEEQWDKIFETVDLSDMEFN